jgi:hypothetical protein
VCVIAIPLEWLEHGEGPVNEMIEKVKAGGLVVAH